MTSPPSQEPPAARDAANELTERYDRGAEVYRELWAPILRTRAVRLVRELRADGIERVLDVGTGVGFLLPDLVAAFPGAFVLGVDRSGGMITLADAGFGRALMDARELALPSGSMDRVFLVFMLFHLENPAAALREAHRVLRPGGRVGTLTWAGELESTALRLWGDCLDEHGAIGLDPAVMARHESVGSPARMESLLREAGFEQPRAWSDELTCRLDMEEVIRLRTSLGSSKPRFDSLAPAAAALCLEEARRRMSRLGPEDFTARAVVVYATACREAPRA